MTQPKDICEVCKKPPCERKDMHTVNGGRGSCATGCHGHKQEEKQTVEQVAKDLKDFFGKDHSILGAVASMGVALNPTPAPCKECGGTGEVDVHGCYDHETGAGIPGKQPGSRNPRWSDRCADYDCGTIPCPSCLPKGEEKVEIDDIAGTINGSSKAYDEMLNRKINPDYYKLKDEVDENRRMALHPMFIAQPKNELDELWNEKMDYSLGAPEWLKSFITKVADEAYEKGREDGGYNKAIEDALNLLALIENCPDGVRRGKALSAIAKLKKV